MVLVDLWEPSPRLHNWREVYHVCGHKDYIAKDRINRATRLCMNCRPSGMNYLVLLTTKIKTDMKGYGYNPSHEKLY